MSSNNEPTRNSEERQHCVYLMQNGDWSTVPDDLAHWELKVFFIKGGAIGFENAEGTVFIRHFKMWTSYAQSSTLQRCKAWLSSALRRMQ